MVSNAQKTVSDLVYPSVFDKLTYTVCNSAGTITPLDSGAAAYWDLSSFTASSDSSTYEYLNVSAGDKTSYPSANVLIKNLAYGNQIKSFYKHDQTKGTFSLVGWESKLSNTKQTYSMDRKELQFPLALKQSSQGSFAYNYTGFGGSGSKTGANKLTVPGFGRLKMPDGTIYDSVYLVLNAWSKQESGKNPEKGERLEWYSWKFKGALAIANINYFYNSMTMSFVGAQPSLVFQKKPLSAPQPSAVNHISQENSFVIYPNPVNELMYINSNKSGIAVAVDLLDMQGKVLQSKTNDQGILKVNMSELQVGMYFARITDENGVIYTLQILKEN